MINVPAEWWFVWVNCCIDWPMGWEQAAGVTEVAESWCHAQSSQSQVLSLSLHTQSLLGCHCLLVVLSRNNYYGNLIKLGHMANMGIISCDRPTVAIRCEASTRSWQVSVLCHIQLWCSACSQSEFFLQNGEFRSRELSGFPRDTWHSAGEGRHQLEEWWQETL